MNLWNYNVASFWKYKLNKYTNFIIYFWYIGKFWLKTDELNE